MDTGDSGFYIDDSGQGGRQEGSVWCTIKDSGEVNCDPLWGVVAVNDSVVYAQGLSCSTATLETLSGPVVGLFVLVVVVVAMRGRSRKEAA